MSGSESLLERAYIDAVERVDDIDEARARARSEGFETYDGRFTRTSATSTTVAERTAEEVAAPAIAWLEQHAREPFFLFVHFFDAHLPYEPPPPFATTFADDP